MACRLCGKSGELKNSHIIPEFVYRPLYDEINRFHVITTKEEEGNRYLQKGIRERLLCGECETQLSKHERYVSLVFSGKLPVNITGNGRLIRVEGLDYEHFKLFAMSVLWRAGVSSHNAFEEVKLGSHEKHLRELILADNPGRPEKYPFLLAPVMHEREQLMGLIVQPTWSRIAGHYAYRFVFSGLAWVFIVSSHGIPKALREAVLNEEGKLVMVPQQFSNMRFLTNMAAELAQKGKLS